MDLNKLSEQCHKNATRLGYSATKHDIVEHLRGEVDELEHAEVAPSNVMLKMVLSQLRDEGFIGLFDKYVKDTEAEELADFIIIAFTRMKELKLDPELVIDCKVRYNDIREVKK